MGRGSAWPFIYLTHVAASLTMCLEFRQRAGMWWGSVGTVSGPVQLRVLGGRPFTDGKSVHFVLNMVTWPHLAAREA